MTKNALRPDAVEVHGCSLRELRGRSKPIEVNRHRVYGLTAELVATDDEGFLAYAREHVEGHRWVPRTVRNDRNSNHGTT